MTKSMIDGKPIEYDPRWPLRPISAERLPYVSYTGCVCSNCGGHEAFVSIKFNESNFRLPNGEISKMMVAKPMSIWLCPDCLDELRKAIEEVEK